MTLTQIKPLGLSKPVDLADDEKIRLGTGNDLQIYHGSAGGGSSFIDTTGSLQIHTTELYINNEANTERLIRGVQNGTAELYYDGSKKIETTSTGVTITGTRTLIDTSGTEDCFRIGNAAGCDTFIRLGSTGTTADTHAVIKYDKDENWLSLLVSGEAHGNGGLKIENGGDVRSHNLIPHYDNSRDLGTTSVRWQDLYISNSVDLEDNAKLLCGNGDDLQIYHDGSNSYIKDAGTGGIYLDTTFLHVRQGSGESMINAVADAQVELFHNNSKKFRTQADGVEILSTGSWHGLEVKHSNGNVVAKLQNKGSGDEGYLALYDSGGTGPSIQMDGEHGRLTCDQIRIGGNADANQMEDYEEGSWTPTFDTSISGGSMTINGYSIQSGFYRKVGSLVYVEGGLKTSSAPTKNSNGTWDIGGLPFTAASGGSDQTSGQLFGGAQANWSVAPDKFTVITSNTRARARGGLNDGASSYTNGNTTMFNTSGTDVNRIYFSGTYIAA